MKKKIIVSFFVMGIICVLLCSCSQKSEEVTQEEENVVIEAEDLGTALMQCYSLLESAENDEEKQELLAQFEESLPKFLNGYYYYKKADTESDYTISEGGQESVKEDNRAIYVKSKEEIYIVPYSENELADMDLTLEEIPNIENSELYKYHIADIKVEEYPVYERIDLDVVFESDFVDGKGVGKDNLNFNTVRLDCCSEVNTRYYITGYFADQTTEIGKYEKENIIDIESYRCYYADEDYAYEVKIENEDKASAQRATTEAEKNAEPAIGMNKAQVTGGAWGYPNQKNIDEYEWGTKEQWVYDGKGYVYFEDGIVTAIQHRD